MSTSITNSFVRQYERDVHDVFQREGSVLKPTVRFVDGVVGSSTTFQKIGKGVATTKARHGTITPMNQDHTAIECTLSDFYAGDWVDKLDEAKINIMERQAIARGGAYALGRKVDDQILTALDGTSQTVVTWDESGEANIRNSLINMVEALAANDAFQAGRVYGVLSTRAWALASVVKEFASADWVDASGRPFTAGMPMGGRYRSWMNVMWTTHTGVPGVGTATSKNFVYNSDAIGYGAGASPGNLAGRMANESAVGADITWHGDRAAHFINHAMSGGAVLIDDTGVIEGNVDDTAALPTS